MSPYESDGADSVTVARIPADTGRPDKIIGPFTARQCALLASGALVLYGGWWACRAFMAPLAYAALITPIAGLLAAVAMGRREGINLDRFAVAALAQARTPRRRVHAPDGIPPLPTLINPRLARAAGPPPASMDMPFTGVSESGVVDLREHGMAALATCSTINFDLRSGAEQQTLTGAFARWLNSLTGPTQVLVRCHRTDLAPLIDQLQHDAPTLAHPALEAAARAHADFLTDLSSGRDLLARQIVLVAREPAGASGGRTGQRLQEAIRALAPADLTVTALSAAESADLLSAACNPDTPTRRQGEPS
ncbi:PrgI family protein [Streptomyces sp. NPDC050738]|uniref:PrgI family protein n=1 Tax=Streptomyces sp. NPDC050738 TaxID=3154744 RepID=UPI003428F20A